VILGLVDSTSILLSLLPAVDVEKSINNASNNTITVLGDSGDGTDKKARQFGSSWYDYFFYEHRPHNKYHYGGYPKDVDEPSTRIIYWTDFSFSLILYLFVRHCIPGLPYYVGRHPYKYPYKKAGQFPLIVKIGFDALTTHTKPFYEYG
jgi:hypothetical protein